LWSVFDEAHALAEIERAGKRVETSLIGMLGIAPAVLQLGAVTMVPAVRGAWLFA
jgi:hypothetical protein